MFTDKELKYLKNIIKIINGADFSLKGEEIPMIAASMTVLQSSIIPKVESMVKKEEGPKEMKSPVKEEPKPKRGRKKKGE